jgi:hypothetical protein
MAEPVGSASALQVDTAAADDRQALRARLGSLLRERGSAAPQPASSRAGNGLDAVQPGSAGQTEADAWATQIEALRSAQRVRDGRRLQAERTLPGREIGTGIRLVETQFQLPTAIASDTLQQVPPWEADAETAGHTLLYLDTETTGLAGGSGTLVFLLGLAWQADATLHVQQWLLTSPGAEREWLAAINAALPPRPLLVSFNGKSFDLPLLATRHRLARCADPFAHAPHWDLMHPLRRAFEPRWPNCRLQTAEKRLLGIERVDDLPGSFAPQAYTSFLRHGDSAMLAEAIRHNRDDVVSLARLLPALRRVYDEPASFDADSAAIARRLRQVGRASAAERVLVAVSNCPAACRELAALHARAQRWDDVERLLRPLAEATQPCTHALERLAKVAEHVRRDPAAALHWARRLAAAEPHETRHAQRIARLQRRQPTPNVLAGIPAVQRIEPGHNRFEQPCAEPV